MICSHRRCSPKGSTKFCFFNPLATFQVRTTKLTPSYIQNKFPVEVLLNYEGYETVNSQFSITLKGKTIFRKKVTFSSDKKSATIIANLTSTKEINISQILFGIMSKPCIWDNAGIHASSWAMDAHMRYYWRLQARVQAQKYWCCLRSTVLSWFTCRCVSYGVSYPAFPALHLFGQIVLTSPM